MAQPKLRFKREDGNEYPSLFQCSIKDVSNIKNGPFGSVLHSSDYVLEGTPIITTEHFKSGIIQSDVSTIPKVSEEDYKRLKGYVLETGDIVFSRVGSIDINALVTERENGWLFSGRVIRVRLNSNYHSGYFHYLLSTQRVKNDIVSRAVGQTMPSINSEILNSTSLMIMTSYEEQQKIADFLSTVDEVIAQSEAEVRNLEQQKKAAMQKIFSQEVRFRHEDETEFPEWEEIKLENAVDFLDEKRKPITSKYRNKGQYPYYGASGIIDYIDDYIFDEELVLLSEDGANIVDRNYRVSFIATGKYWVNNHAHCLRAKKDFSSYFLSEALENIDYTVYNTGSAQPKLNQEVCRNLPLVCPCLEEQQRIADFLSAYDDAITCAKQELDKWKELKKGLLQQMFV